jgi:HK97 family phage portal protein
VGVREFFGFGSVETRSGSTGSAGGDSPPPAILPPPRTPLADVTPREALRIDVIGRAVDLINTQLSGLTLKAYNHLGLEIPRSDTKNFPQILRKPSLLMDPEEFLQQTVNDFALHGEFFWMLTRDQYTGGRVVDIRPVSPLEVTAVLDPQTGRTTYGWQHRGNIPSSMIVHKKHTAITGEARGSGPIKNGQPVLRAAVQLSRFQSLWFDGDRPPDGVLSTDQPLNPIQRQEIGEAWNAWLRSEDGRTAILSAGVSYELLLLKPADAQMVEVGDAIDRKLARIMGVAAFDLLVPGGTESRTYQNLEQSNMSFLQNTLAKYINAIERAFTEVIGRTQEARFDTAGLIRLDAKTQVEIDAAQIQMGTRTADELRARDGLRPLPKPAPEPTAPAPGSVPARTTDKPTDDEDQDA